MSRGRLVVLAIALVAPAGAGIALVAALLARAVQEKAFAQMHGQARWSPGERRSPAFAIRDQSARLVTLARLRQRPVLLTFVDSRCQGQCPIEGRQLGMMLSQITPAERPTLVIVGVNPSGDTPASIRQAMARCLAGPWRWHWLRGTEAQLAPVRGRS